MRALPSAAVIVGTFSVVACSRSPPSPQWNAALNGIIGEANTTLGLLNRSCDSCAPNPRPIFQDIISQAAPHECASPGSC